MSPKPYTLHYFNKITFSLSQDKVGIWLMFHVKLHDRYCLKPKGQSMLVKDSNNKPRIMTASSSKNCCSPIPPFCSLGIAQQIRSEMENGGRFTYQNSTIQIYHLFKLPFSVHLMGWGTGYGWVCLRTMVGCTEYGQVSSGMTVCCNWYNGVLLQVRTCLPLDGRVLLGAGMGKTVDVLG